MEPNVECIEVTRWFSFSAGNAIKYAWRHKSKGSAKDDLKKARWYVADDKRHGGATNDKAEKAIGKIKDPVLHNFCLALYCRDHYIANSCLTHMERQCS